MEDAHDTIKVLVFGDIVGQIGIQAVFFNLLKLKKTYNADIVIVNGENAYEGKGITPEICETLFKSGVDVITSGNHIWQQKEIFPFLNQEDRLLRPENYPVDNPGKGNCVIRVKDIKVGIINLEGRVFLSNTRSPFLVGKEICTQMRNVTRVIIIDFHAEWPEEKEALALYLDGYMSALIGTHTHVQTADERILPGGSGYITDIGMTGPSDSIIGMSPDIAIKKNLTQMPLKMMVQNKSADIMGVFLEIEIGSGKTLTIKRIWEKSVI